MENRSIQLSSRNENTRDSKIQDMHISKLDEILRCFLGNIESIENKFKIAEQLTELGNEEAAKDIYRTQVVFLDSALDFYMHSLGIYAMEQMYKGNWEKTSAYKDLKIPINQVMDAISHPENTEWIDEAIIGHLSTKTYMNSGEIKGLLTLVHDGKLFKQIADKMYYDRDSNIKTETKLRELLNSLFMRRNKIAHQADRDHVTGELYDIEKQEVKSFIQSVKTFVLELHRMLVD